MHADNSKTKAQLLLQLLHSSNSEQIGVSFRNYSVVSSDIRNFILWAIFLSGSICFPVVCFKTYTFSIIMHSNSLNAIQGQPSLVPMKSPYNLPSNVLSPSISKLLLLISPIC